MLKGLPLAYDKDMQEDKEALFDATDTLRACLKVTSTVLQNMRLNEAVARQAASHGYLNATELADYLVRKGVPFREAHETVGRAVVRAIELGVELQELSLEVLRSFSEIIDDEVFEALSLTNTLNSKSQVGGTAAERVRESLAIARASLFG
jgi:argininosuccinate lyase